MSNCRHGYYAGVRTRQQYLQKQPVLNARHCHTILNMISHW